MKWILNVFLLGLVLTTSPMIFAADAADNYVSVNGIANMDDLEKVANKCATVRYMDLDVVDPKDYTICENDISYGILQMVFQKIFSENEILPAMASRDAGNDSLAYAYNIGGPIIAIIEAVTWLTFTLSGIVLTFVTIKTLNISATSGQFMGNWNSVYVMTRTLGAMALIVPIGSFSLAQVLVLVVALFGIMGGNYIWGAFLSMQQAESIVMEKAGGDMSNMSISQAESLVKSSSCSLRSAAAAVQLNQKKLPTGNWFDVDADTHMDRLSSCSRNSLFIGRDAVFTSFETTQSNIDGHKNSSTSSWSNYLTGAKNVFPLSTIAFGSPSYCKSDSFVDATSTAYSKEVYGDLYQCGNIQFNTVDLSEFQDTNDSNLEEDPWYKDTKQSIVDHISRARETLNPNDLYQSISTKGYENRMSDKSFNPSDYEKEIEKVKNVLVDVGTELFSKIKANTNSTSPNPPVAFEGTYVGMSAIFNNYMGASYNAEFYDDFWENWKSIEAETVDGGFSVSRNKAIQIYVETERPLELSGMYNDARVAAGYILSAHCAKIWATDVSLFNSSSFYMEMLKTVEGREFGDVLGMGMGTLSSECIVPLNRSDESLDRELISIFKKMPEYDSSNPDNMYYLAMAEVEGKTYREKLSGYPNVASDMDDVAFKTATMAISLDSTKKANSKIAGMTAYNYVVRKATEQAMEQIFQKNTNTDFLINMRNLGWASAGGFILSISNNGSELSKYSKSIQNQISWNSNDSNEKGVHASLLKDNNLNYNSMDETIKKIYSDLVRNKDYSDLNQKETTEVSFSIIIRFFEDLLTAPLSHLKAVGGFDQNKTIREGAQDCYEKGKCTITSVHPVTALLNVGNDIIELCFNIVILKLITGALVMLDAKASSAPKADASSSMFSVVLGGLSSHPVMKVLFAIAKVADVFLGLLTSTIIPPLFVVGIFFSFVIPMMPFLAFLMGFIGWLMLILELLIAVNVWILLMATPDQNGGSRADPRAVFGFIGQLVLKPGLMVVALVFGWYLSSISVYFLNMTIFGALSPTKSGSFMGLLDFFMFYIVYLIMIFIAVKHSFKIIEILPDKIFSLINIAKASDVKSESLGMERLVQLAAGDKVFGLVMAPGKLIDEKKEEAQDLAKEYKLNLASQKSNDILGTHENEKDKQDALDLAKQEAVDKTDNSKAKDSKETNSNPDGSDKKTYEFEGDIGKMSKDELKDYEKGIIDTIDSDQKPKK